MKLYFDTNVYDYIAKCGNAAETRDKLDEQGCSVEASALNLIEIWRIPNWQARTEHVRTVTAIAREYEQLPRSYAEAREVLAELRRIRPAWVRRFASRDEKRRIRMLLNGHREHWREARLSPGSGGERIDNYIKIANTGDPDAQKQLRRVMLPYLNPVHGLQMYSSDPNYQAITKGYGPAEFFWRNAALVTWQAAILAKLPAVRDLRDWAGPYLSEAAFRGQDQLEFWYVEADASRLPITRMKGLVGYYQLQRRVTPGNAHDIEHSAYALAADVFLTADESFDKTLTAACSHHGNTARLCFVDKKFGNPADSIFSALDYQTDSA
jgi:hypothetical protein